MRKIPLKTPNIVEMDGREVPFPYLNLFEQFSKFAGQPGLTAEEMDIPLAIGESLVNARRSNARHVLLEENQWAYLVDRAKKNRWPFISPVFQELVADLEKAEKVDPNAKQPLSVAGNC